MRNLGKIVIAWVLVLVGLLADSVTATVNTQEVVKGNPVELRIKAVGKSASFPSIDQINGISVRNTGNLQSSSMNITSSSTKSETQTTKTYEFVPNRDMTIPSYTVNISGVEYKTKPIKLKVVTSQAPTVQGNKKFSFVLKADRKSVWVGESFVMTLFISVSKTLRGAKIKDFFAPTSADFFLQEVGEQKEYQKNNTFMIEKRYIVTAKKEGNFSIAPASAKLGQPDRSRQDFFGRYGMRWTPMVSNSLDIEVKAQSSETDLVGSFKIEANVDTQKTKLNKPVNLMLKIEGKGSLEDFVFPRYEIEGVTIYSDEAKVQSNLVGSTLMSTYSKSFAFIAEDDFVIPEKSITVYNPDTKKVETLKIQKYEINIENKSAVKTNPVQSKPVQDLKPDDDVIKENMSWQVLVLTFVLGGLCMYLLRFVPKVWRKKQLYYSEAEALKFLYAHISEGGDVEAMVRKLYAKKNGDKSIIIDKKELKEMVDRFRDLSEL